MDKLKEYSHAKVPIKTQLDTAKKQIESAGFKYNRKNVKKVLNEERQSRLFKNDTYTVLLREGKLADDNFHVEEWRGKCAYISIRRNDREPKDNWRDFQEIKNQLGFSEREAVQIYPAESRLVDTANQYHLWVLPENVVLPIGFVGQRVVSGVSTEHEGLITKQSNR